MFSTNLVLFAHFDILASLFAIGFLGVRVFHVSDDCVKLVLDEVVADEFGDGAGTQKLFALCNLCRFVTLLFITLPFFGIFANILTEDTFEGISDTVELLLKKHY